MKTRIILTIGLEVDHEENFDTDKYVDNLNINISSPDEFEGHIEQVVLLSRKTSYTDMEKLKKRKK